MQARRSGVPKGQTGSKIWYLQTNVFLYTIFLVTSYHMVLPIFSFVARMMCLDPPFVGNSLLQLRSSPRPPQEAQEVTDLLLNYPHVTASIRLLLQG